MVAETTARGNSHGHRHCRRILRLHFARDHSSDRYGLDTHVSDRALVLRFTIATLLGLLVPAAVSIAYLNLGFLPEEYANFTRIPWWSIGYFLIAATAITVLLRRQRSVSAIRSSRPRRF